MINILCWNIRGIYSRGSSGYLTNIVSSSKVDLLVILEPKVDSSHIGRLARNLGFGSFAHGDSLNKYIWLFWKDNIQLTNFVWGDQQATCDISFPDFHLNLMCSFIYAQCNRAARQLLWEELINIGANSDKPWLVGGDFNVISSWDEKKGGNRSDDGSMNDFNEFMMHACLGDAGFFGNRFTWCNNRRGGDRILERLDRFLINGNFLSSFPSIRVSHLARNCSDHSPLLIDLDPSPRRLSRFHYLTIWEEHPGFKELVKDSWQGTLHAIPLINFSLKLKNLRTLLRSWNWNIFGDLRRKALELSCSINRIEDGLQAGWSDQLARDLASAKSMHADVLRFQECMLRHKAKVKWLKDGDRNSAFFHASIRARRSQIRIQLAMGDGSNTEDREVIGEAAVAYFTELFQGHHPPPPRDIFEGFDKVVTDSINAGLVSCPTFDEIHVDIRNMERDSSPGPDGFTTQFYLTFWDVICDDLVKAIRAFFQGHQLLRRGLPPLSLLFPRFLMQLVSINFGPLAYVMCVTRLYPGSLTRD